MSVRAGRRRLPAWLAGMVLGVLPAVVNPAPVGAASLTVQADADARVSQKQSGSNYGHASELTAVRSPAEESYIRFRVAGSGGGISRAVIRLFVTNGSSDGPALYPATGAWDERKLTWKNKPASGATALADLPAVKTGWVEYDVTPAVPGDGTYSFVLKSGSQDNTMFSSKEANDNRPHLVVTTGGATSSTTMPPSTTTTSPSTTTTSPSTTTTSPLTSIRTFDPVADGNVAMDDPTLNFGSTPNLETDAVPVVEAFIKFAVDGLGGPVRSAKVRTYVTNGSGNGPALYRSGTDWTEGGLSWSNRPARTTAALEDKGAVSAGAWIEFDVTSVVKADGVYSFNLATSSNDGTDVASREAAVDRRPRLVVEFAGSAADTTPPDTMLDSAPSGVVQVDNATFAFHATEGSTTFNCRVDSGAWTPCSSPATVEGLADGTHRFAVRATDAAGNTDPTPAEHDFTVAVVDIRRAPLAPASGAHFGAHVQAADRTEPVVSAAVGQVESAVQRTLGIDHWYEPWPNVFPTWREAWDLSAGRIPLISWGKTYTDQIARGDHDAYIRARAQGVKQLGQPVMIRWFWEMDGSRNTEFAISPTHYISAWRRIVDIFRAEGATNAAWVWCPNASGFNNGEAQNWYPGDGYVDWLCADGYNFYPERTDNRSFDETFASFYGWARQRPKPIVIGEYGALQAGPGERAAWIDAARTVVKTEMTRILGLAWFHSIHEHDWTLLSEPSAVDAFRRMGQDPYFNPAQ